MCKNHLQETAIKICIRFSGKSYKKLKMTDMIVYKKCELLLKAIINKRFLQSFLSEEYKSKMLVIPLVIVKNWDCQYFSLSHKTSSRFFKLLL